MAWESVKKLLIGGASIDFTFNDSLLQGLINNGYVEGGYDTVGYSCTLSTLIADNEHKTPDFHEYNIGDAGYKIGFGYQNSQLVRYIYDPVTGNSFGYTGVYQYPQTGTLGILPLLNEAEQKGMFVMVVLHYPTTAPFIQFESVGDRNSANYLTACYNAIMDAIPQAITSNGGGATHIAKRTGQLKDLSSYTSDILIVSGGGGGGLLVGETDYSGKEAGGISGSGDNSADQTTGNAFGLGESGTDVSGGGSGLYGGYKGTSSKSGGAGSGYIGNSLLSNKKMVGYNVPTSSAEGTKTESVEVFDSNYIANKPKAGNGHARIKFLREPGRKVQTLIDSSQGIKDSIFDNIVTIPNNDYGNDTWQFDQNGVLFINERNSNRASVNAKFLKGNATKLYIETSYEHRNTYGSNYRWQFVFLDNLYEGQHTPPSFLARTYFVLHTNQYNIIDNDPWYDLPSTVIELSLNDIPSNQRFYISFTSCDGHTEITKMYFDDEVYIVD